MGGLKSPGYLECIQKVWKLEGFKGFYNGWAPTIIGSILTRSAFFTVYEIVHSRGEQNETMKQCIPGTGIQFRVFLGGFIAGSARSLIECPFEYAKVKRQTGQVW